MKRPAISIWRLVLALILLSSFGLLPSAVAGPLTLYVSEGGEKRIAIYHMDEATGELTRAAAVDLPGSPGSLSISPDGRFVYASNRGHDSLAVFSVNTQTGDLTSLGQTPTEKTPRSFCLMPGGEKFVVSAGEGSHRLIVFRRDAQTGALTPLKTYDCGKGPGWVLGVKFD